MHREKYELPQDSPSPRPSLSEKFASYYGNLRGRLLGSNLTGRRTACPENLFADEAQLLSVKKEKDDGQLKPKSVDLQRGQNRYDHRTNEYELPNLILRRGQSFEISVTFDRLYQPHDEEISLRFVTGSRPMQSKGTVILIKESAELSNSSWGFVVRENKEKIVTLRVMVPCDVIIGRYQLFIETVHKSVKDDKGEKGDIERHRYKHPDDIYILFNPWCEGDSVYLPEELQRDEYVLSEKGRIWLGTINKFCVRPWNFAQFDDVCLMAALALMEKSELGEPARAHPLPVVKALSKMINNNERDGGVMVGNWSGKYDDGVPPYAWNGSAPILEEFLKRRKGVKFGQCWTFAAVATTVFRTLGIPTRCITNFKSAHDNDYDSSIDNYWKPDCKPHKLLNDHIWDFHVWNESWFERPDLPAGYSGWQAYDTTPQEVSEGVFACGPAPVTAILNGDLHIPFDAKYLFAEIHGDRIHWQVEAEGNMSPIGRETNIVGRYISTKAVSAIAREDLTSTYKHPEDTEDEKTVRQKASQHCFQKITDIPHLGPQDVEFQFSGEGHRSGDVGVVLKMRNTGPEPRIVDVHISAVSAMYTGVSASELKENTLSTIIEPQSESQVALSMKASEYINNVDADAHVSFYVMASVKGTGQTFSRRESYWIDKLQLEIDTQSNVHLGKQFDLCVKITNPLSVPLTGGHLNIEAPGMQRVAAVKVKKTIGPGEEIHETVQLKPRRAGKKEIIANFYCKQVSDVTGVTEVDVIEENK